MANETIKYRVCDKCPTETLATETHKLTLNGYRYDIDLCDKHVIALQAVIESWTESATLVGEPTLFDKPRTIGSSSLSNLKPREAVQSVSELAPHTGPVVADYADKWAFTSHAELRMKERQLGLQEILQTAEYPERVEPSTRKEGYYVHRRGDIKVVVHGHSIITVVRDTQEMEMASGS